MGASTEELKNDIAATRSDMSETLDAIGDRVSPGRIIERRKARMSMGVQSLRDRVMGTVHDATDAVRGVGDELGGNVGGVPEKVRQGTEGAPLVAGALAFGVGFLVASITPTSAVEEQAAEKLIEKVDPVKEEALSMAKDMAEHLKEPATESARAVAETAKQGARDVATEVKTAAQETRDQAASASSQ
jgi:hypothetical protein